MHTKHLNKRVLIIGLIYIILAFLGFNLPRLYCNEIKPYIQYNNALKLINTGKYDEAISILDNIKDYKNSNDKILFAYYKEACELYDKEQYEDAIQILNKIPQYSEAEDKINDCQSKIIENELSEFKISSMDTLGGDIDINIYRDEEQQKILSYAEEAKANIENANNKAEINGIIDEFNNNVSQLKTDEDYKQEEKQIIESENNSNTNSSKIDTVINHVDISSILGKWRSDFSSGNYRIFTIQNNYAENILYSPNGKVQDSTSGTISWSDSGYMIVTGNRNGYEGGSMWYKIENVTSDSFDDNSLKHHYYRIQ